MTNLIESLFLYIGQSIFVTVGQLLVFIAPGLAIAFVMQVLAGQVERLATHTMGRVAFHGLFGWLGISVHELGHVLFGLLFGHNIVKVQLFNPNPYSAVGGYVLSLYNSRSIYQRVGRFFIGIGPILFGTVVIYSAARLLLDSAIFLAMDHALAAGAMPAESFATFALLDTTVQGSWAFLSSLFNPAYLLDWRWYLFLYIAFAIGSFIRLSRPDIQGAMAGFTTFVGCLLFWNIGTLWMGDLMGGTFGFVGQFYVFFYAIMSITIIMNLLAIGLLLAIAAITRRTMTR